MAANNPSIQRLNWHPEVLIIERLVQPLPWSKATLQSCFSEQYDNLGYWSATSELLAFVIVQRVSDCWTLMNIATKPTVQRQGIGKQLLQSVQGNAQRQQADIVLEVRYSNTAAQHLYSCCGFTVVGHRKGYYQTSDNTGEDALVMRWNSS